MRAPLGFDSWAAMSEPEGARENNVAVTQSLRMRRLHNEAFRNLTVTFGASLRGAFRPGPVRFGHAQKSHHPRESRRPADVSRLFSDLLARKTWNTSAGDR